MGDLVCVRIFFSNLWRRIFSSIMHQREFFFQSRNFFPRFWFSFKIFSLEISLQGIFILKSPLPLPAPFLQKANGRPLTDKFHMFLLWCLIRVKSTFLSEEIYLQSPREDFAQWKSKLKMNRIFNPRFG